MHSHDNTEHEHSTPNQKQATTNSRKVYTVREVSALLGISRETVFGLLRTGQLRSVLIGKRGRRITDLQLDAYLRSLEGRPPDGA